MRPKVLSPRSSAGLLVLATLIVGGCGQSPTTPSSALTQEQADDVAQQLAASLSTSHGGAMTEMDAARTHAVSASSGAFGTSAAESTFSTGGVSYWLSVAFYDAGGSELPGWDTTAVRMVVASRATGSVTGPEYTAAVAHAALLEVLGIEAASDRLTFSGLARDTLDAEFHPADSSGTRTLDAKCAAAWEDVVALKDKDINPWPLSGRLLWQAVVDATFPHQGQQVSAHHEVTAWVEFNGTRYPTIVVDGMYSYRTDLQNGAVQRV